MGNQKKIDLRDPKIKWKPAHFGGFEATVQEYRVRVQNVYEKAFGLRIDNYRLTVDGFDMEESGLAKEIYERIWRDLEAEDRRRQNKLREKFKWK